MQKFKSVFTHFPELELPVDNLLSIYEVWQEMGADGTIEAITDASKRQNDGEVFNKKEITFFKLFCANVRNIQKAYSLKIEEEEKAIWFESSREDAKDEGCALNDWLYCSVQHYLSIGSNIGNQSTTAETLQVKGQLDNLLELAESCLCVYYPDKKVIEKLRNVFITDVDVIEEIKAIASLRQEIKQREVVLVAELTKQIEGSLAFSNAYQDFFAGVALTDALYYQCAEHSGFDTSIEEVIARRERIVDFEKSMQNYKQSVNKIHPNFYK